MFDKKGEYRLSVKELNLHRGACLNIIKVGVPCGINSTVFSFSNVVTQSNINAFGATVINILGVCGVRILWILLIFPLIPDSPAFLYMAYPFSHLVNLIAITVYFVHVRNQERTRLAAAQNS